MSQTLDLNTDAFRIRPVEGARAGDPVPVSPVGRRWWLAAAVTLLVALLPTLLWAGEISWTNDEPQVLAHAALFNREGRLAPQGLSGSFGIEYGPVATQGYQLLLLLTREPVAIARLHGGLSAGVLAIALLWLGRMLSLSPWVLPALLLAPFVVWSNRTLWDATFAVPIGALALAAYADWLRAGGSWRIALACCCVTLVPFCHLQGVPLFVGVVGHLLWSRRRPHSRREMLAAMAGFALAISPNAVYLVNVLGILPLGFVTIAGAGHTGSAMPRILAPLVPLMGGRLFTAEQWASWAAHPSLPNDVQSAAALGTYLAVPLLWLGLIVMVIAMLRGRVRRRAPHTDTSHAHALPLLEIRRGVFAVAAIVLSVQATLFTLMRAPPWPQYFYGTFVIDLLLVWVGLQTLSRWRLRLPLIVLLAVAGGTITGHTLWDRHRHGPPRELGPTLANQSDVARQLLNYGTADVWTDVPLYQQYPQAIRSLTLLHRSPSPLAQPLKVNGRLVIRFALDQPADRGRIELIDLPAELPLPPGMTPLNVTPMSRWY